MFFFSNLEKKNPALVKASTSIRNLRDSIKSFDFSDLPHTEISTAYSVTTDPKGFTEFNPVANPNRRQSNIKCKAGNTKFGKTCGKSMAKWSSLKQHLRDFHTNGTKDDEGNETPKQYEWPAKSKKPVLPVYNEDEDEAEPEMIICFLCNPRKNIESNRFNVSKYLKFMFHLKWFHSGALWGGLWKHSGQALQRTEHERVEHLGKVYISCIELFMLPLLV